MPDHDYRNAPPACARMSDASDNSDTEATIGKRLAVSLFEAKGDASSTVQVLLGYYKCKSQLTGKSQPADAKTYNEPDYSTIIREESNEATISALSPWLTKSTKRLWF